MLKIKSLSVPSAPLKMAENYTQEVCCIMAIQFHENMPDVKITEFIPLGAHSAFLLPPCLCCLSRCLLHCKVSKVLGHIDFLFI